MRLLHISDIHFNSPRCKTNLDPDRPFRTALVNDLTDRVAASGPVDAILLTGDTAYKGSPEEYTSAQEWLTQVAEVSGCNLTRLFVVPGNHDVDRAIARSRTTKNAQDAIANAASPRERERVLEDHLRDEDAATALFRPLTAYNEFAAAFRCQVYAPERPLWGETLPLDDRTSLRIHGLTSVLVSGGGDRDAKPGSMYLSPLQTAMDAEPGIVNLVMSHHPPSWLVDQEAVEDAFTNRAHIQLFGHEHRHRVFGHQQYVKFAAGAVNPERHEPGWKPGYNIISVSIEHQATASHVLVEADMREWQESPGRFRAIEQHDGSTVFKHRVAFRAREAVMAQDECGMKIPVAGTPTAAVPTEAEEEMDADKTRDLVRRFFALSGSQRREIVFGLDLLEEQEMALPEPQRYDRALRRASERGILGEVAERVKRLEQR